MVIKVVPSSHDHILFRLDCDWNTTFAEGSCIMTAPKATEGFVLDGCATEPETNRRRAH